MHEQLAFTAPQRVVFIVCAQEKNLVFLAEKRRNLGGVAHPWIVKVTGTAQRGGAQLAVGLDDQSSEDLKCSPFLALGTVRAGTPATRRCGFPPGYRHWFIGFGLPGCRSCEKLCPAGGAALVVGRCGRLGPWLEAELLMSLDDQDARRSVVIGDLRLPTPAVGLIGDDQQGPASGGAQVEVLFELNLTFPGGLQAVTSAFFAQWSAFGPAAAGAVASGIPLGLQRVSDRLYQGVLTRVQLDRLITADGQDRNSRPVTIFKAWPDYVLYPQIDRSASTVKADAGWRSYRAAGTGVVWAVIDSGIEGTHQHFAALELARELADPTGTPARLTGGLHRDFTYLVSPSQLGPPGQPAPLHDELGHGSHVAGIIAGQCPTTAEPTVASSNEPAPGIGGFVPRLRTGVLSGMAPQCELVSLKVMRRNSQGNWMTSFAAVIAALEYIRTEVNVSRSAMRIHGVNLSLGCDWDPLHYAAGQSPLCQAVNELVASGVVVVISSGNGGSTFAPNDARQGLSLMGSVTEPGHAQECITVGSTHRDAPLTFGVSWTSGKGPTLDGRAKPDVVAPGEWITSVAVGQVRAKAGLDQSGTDPTSTYAEQSGTSMAAPHVSGVIAGLLSARPELIGRPQVVKTLVTGTATDLGRERYAQGHGLIDAMRMLANS